MLPEHHVRLGVNIDHVATVRNARGEDYPSPYKAAIIAKKAHQNGTTLKEEAVKSGLINEKEFDKIVNPKKMVKPS